MKDLKVNVIGKIIFTHNKIIRKYDGSSIGGNDSEPGAKIFKEWEKVNYRLTNESIKEIKSSDIRFQAGQF